MTLHTTKSRLVFLHAAWFFKHKRGEERRKFSCVAATRSNCLQLQSRYQFTHMCGQLPLANCFQPVALLQDPPIQLWNTDRARHFLQKKKKQQPQNRDRKSKKFCLFVCLVGCFVFGFGFFVRVLGAGGATLRFQPPWRKAGSPQHREWPYRVYPRGGLTEPWAPDPTLTQSRDWSVMPKLAVFTVQNPKPKGKMILPWNWLFRTSKLLTYYLPRCNNLKIIYPGFVTFSQCHGNVSYNFCETIFELFTSTSHLLTEPKPILLCILGRAWEEAHEGFSILYWDDPKQKQLCKTANLRSVPLIYDAHVHQRAVSGPGKDGRAFPSWSWLTQLDLFKYTNDSL